MNELEIALMKRDGLTLDEADSLILETYDELTSGNFEAMMDILGLEDDYVFDVIDIANKLI